MNPKTARRFVAPLLVALLAAGAAPTSSAATDAASRAQSL